MVVFLLILTLALPAFSQELRVEPGEIYPTDSFEYIVSFAGDRAPAVEIGESELFEVRGQGTRSYTNCINGQCSNNIELAYQLFPKKLLSPGEYKLPEVTVNNQKLKPLSVNVRKQAGGPWDAKQTVSKTSVYIGEQFLYELSFSTSLSVHRLTASPINFEGFLGYPLVPDLKETRRGSFIQRYAIFAKESGEFSFPQRSLNLVYFDSQNRRPGFGSLMFGQAKSRSVFAHEVDIDVKPLPPKPADAQSYIPVGELKISSNWKNTTVKQGEPIRLEFAIAGDANLGPLKLDNQMLDKFELYEVDSNTTSTNTDKIITQTKTFEVDVIPYEAGSYEAPEIFVYSFNPKEEKYVKHTVTPERLTVLPDRGFSPIEKSESVEDPQEEPEQQIIPAHKISTPVARSVLATALGTGPTASVLLILIALFRSRLQKIIGRIRLFFLRIIASSRVGSCQTPQEIRDLLINFLARAANKKTSTNTVRTVRECSEALEIPQEQIVELVERLEIEQYKFQTDIDKLRKDSLEIIKKCI